MNRRELLTKFFKKQRQTKTTASLLKTTVTTSLNQYEGDFGFLQAKHLLRRAMYGPTAQQIKDAESAGLSETIDLLFADVPPIDPPINYLSNHPDEVPLGETWVNELYHPSLQVHRVPALQYWMNFNKLYEGVSIQQKMVEFWATHFVCTVFTTNVQTEALTAYHYVDLINQYAFGNFKELTEKITVEPAMLKYLNGSTNVASAPNENYARELLELFTLGKGPIVTTSPGEPADYTHYTEHDVIQIAKILTGWKIQGYFSTEPVDAFFVEDDHDNTTKELSHRFDNQLVVGNGENEYKDLINIIFEKEECAKHICRRLYRYFIYHDITEEIETEIIEPMADILRDNDYEIKPALKALLSSEHFFEEVNIGAMIKNPIEFRIGIYKQYCNIYNPVTIADKVDFGDSIRTAMSKALMPTLSPPDVAGWPAYYQAPNYYELWLNSVSIRPYVGWVNWLMNWGQNGYVDIIALLQSLETPSDAIEVVRELTDLYWPCPASEERINHLKDALVDEVPNYEWGVLYFNWQADPNNGTFKNQIKEAMKRLMREILSLPESYMN